MDGKISIWFDKQVEHELGYTGDNDKTKLLQQTVSIFAANCWKGYEAEGGGIVKPTRITGRQKVRMLILSLKFDDVHTHMQLFDAVRDIIIRHEEEDIEGLAFSSFVSKMLSAHVRNQCLSTSYSAFLLEI